VTVTVSIARRHDQGITVLQSKIARRQRTPLRGCLIHVECLERRQMMAADSGLDERFTSFGARGTPVGNQAAAVNGQYVLRMARTSSGASQFDYQHRPPAVPAGWSVSEIGFGFYRVNAAGTSLQQVQAWGRRSGVLYIEPSTRVTSSVSPNDPLYSSPANGLWGLKKIGMEQAWGHGRGSSNVVVAVMDTGIDTTHPDLRPNLWRNPGEVAGNGLDDDGNGYVDDIHGWHAFFRNGDVTDLGGHGTHVAGTIGAVGNNGIGVAGVGWNIGLMAVNIDTGVGGLGNIEEGITYVIKQKLAGVNVAAINGSFGGGSFSRSQFDLIRLAGDAGIIWVGAAGNSGNDNDSAPAFPASYKLSNIISVAASTDTTGDGLADFSNYGRTSVHLAAPGVNIMSTVPGAYGLSQGTSMAAPHVAGVVGLLKSIIPNATAAQIRAAILGSVDKSSLLDGSLLPYDQLATGGRLNAARAVEFLKRGVRPQPIPNPPPFAGTPDVAVTGSSVVEGHSGLRQLVFTITVSQPTQRGTRVEFETVNGSAFEGRDYVRASGVAFVQPNQRNATVTVMVRGNRLVDGNRSFTLRLSSPTNGRLVGAAALGRIYDDDGPGGVVLGAAYAASVPPSGSELPRRSVWGWA
jgi:subtilisin family serine protease